MFTIFLSNGYVVTFILALTIRLSHVLCVLTVT